jgi:hypothetical protein
MSLVCTTQQLQKLVAAPAMIAAARAEASRPTSNQPHDG